MSGPSFIDPIGPSFQTVTLDRLRVAAQERIGAFTLQSADLRMVEDMVTRDLVYGLVAEVLAERLPPESVSDTRTFGYKTPASPFQHWKLKHADSWWLRWFADRRPVRFDHHTVTANLTVNLERYRTYPEANIQLPPDKFGAPVRVAVATPIWGWDR